MKPVSSIWRGWALGVVVLWVAAFTLLPEIEAPPPVARPAERWEPPSLPVKRDLTAATVALSSSPLWGSRPSSEAPKRAEDTRWALSGIFLRSGDRGRVVVRFASDRPTLELTVGDELPDGSRIVSIEPSRVCAVKDRKRECLTVPSATRPGF